VTEAFAALAAGADVLKMFPAEQLGPIVVKAWRAVIPASVMLVPVGGITPDSLKEFTAAGASAFGLGSALYKPGMSADENHKLTTFIVPPRWLFLKIETDEGIVGWGEPVVEGRALTVEAAVKELGRLPDRQGSPPDRGSLERDVSRRLLSRRRRS
jgi:hypothetical protein